MKRLILTSAALIIMLSVYSQTFVTYTPHPFNNYGIANNFRITENGGLYVYAQTGKLKQNGSHIRSIRYGAGFSISLDSWKKTYLKSHSKREGYLLIGMYYNNFLINNGELNMISANNNLPFNIDVGILTNILVGSGKNSECKDVKSIYIMAMTDINIIVTLGVGLRF
jgi:hypothetical protein